MKTQRNLKRNRINDELDYISHFPLTIAVAAMGYGKTVSSRDFLNDSNANYVWLSIDSDETSPQYIWDSLTRQMSKSQPELGNTLRALGFPADMAQRDKIIQMIEDHTYNSNTIMVIDDYHYVHSPAFDNFIEYVVRAGIKGLHILILSRTIPDMNIDELRLKDHCYLIKNACFELNASEIKEYFQLYGYHLTEDMADSVLHMSEGWISAVYLIMQRYTEMGRLEQGRSIERLIETAVIPRYTDDEILLLKSLCVFDSFTPQQAVYVTSNDAAFLMLQRLSFGNSFIRFDEQNGIYRIHKIFNDYLRKLLEEQPSDLVPDNLYNRSGEWCVQNNDILSGLKYFLKAKEFDRILAEFEKNSITKIIDSNSEVIRELFEKIPVEIRYGHPVGFLSYIGFYVTNINQIEGKQLLTRIKDHYKNNSDLTPVMLQRIYGEIELIHAYIEFNDVVQMHKRLKKAHELLKGQSFIANKDKIITFGSPHILYLYYRDKGKMLWTVEQLEELYPYYRDMAGGCGTGFEYQIRSEYSLETGDLDRAELFAYKAIYKARTLDQLSVIICANLCLARVAAARGKFDEALEIMDTLRIEVEESRSTILGSTLDLCTGYIEAIKGEEGGFANWLRTGEIKQSEILYQGMGFNYIVYGKYLLIHKDYIKLEILCEEMQEIFSNFHNLIGLLHTWILDAITKYNLNDIKQAKAALLAAIEIAREDQIMLPFAEYGGSVLQIFKELQKDLKDDEFIEKLMESAGHYSVAQTGKRNEPSAVSVLSNREKEILILIADGKTNREIATILFIAEVTVRKTITSIYRKLNTAGRAAAVKKAIELRII
ncbi:MAG: LuxR C-terminal-related transcriptional regulator [Bacillota bacterium]